MVQGTSQAREKRTLTNELPEYEMRAYLQQRNGWIPSIGLHNQQ
jgi:hypothetical protein